MQDVHWLHGIVSLCSEEQLSAGCGLACQLSMHEVFLAGDFNDRSICDQWAIDSLRAWIILQKSVTHIYMNTHNSQFATLQLIWDLNGNTLIDQVAMTTPIH